MNLISILTQYDPNVNYFGFGKQSWSQVELIFGVEKEYLNLFLDDSIAWDIPFKFVVNEQNDYNELIKVAESYFILFLVKDEIWGPEYLSQLKKYFIQRQDLGKSLHNSNDIKIDLISINRNIFYFLGKSSLNGVIAPVMSFSEELHSPFTISKLIKSPTFLQPGVKFLLPLRFIRDNNIRVNKDSDNDNFNISLFTLNILTYLYKSNNYFEPQYFSCYLDFTVNTETISIEKYKTLYIETLVLKKDIFTHDRHSNITKVFNLFFRKH